MIVKNGLVRALVTYTLFGGFIPLRTSSTCGTLSRAW
jgi:hypothetical protein